MGERATVQREAGSHKTDYMAVYRSHFVNKMVISVFTLSPESYLRLPRDLVSLLIGAAWGLSIMLVMSRRFGAGFLGVTGLSGKRGLVMLSGQRPLYPPVPGNSLLRFKLVLFVFGIFWRMQCFCFWKHPG